MKTQRSLSTPFKMLGGELGGCAKLVLEEDSRPLQRASQFQGLGHLYSSNSWPKLGHTHRPITYELHVTQCLCCNFVPGLCAIRPWHQLRSLCAPVVRHLEFLKPPLCAVIVLGYAPSGLKPSLTYPCMYLRAVYREGAPFDACNT